MSPLSRGLFKRAILQSGSIVGLDFFSPPMDALAEMNRYVDAIGMCRSPNTNKEIAIQ